MKPHQEQQVLNACQDAMVALIDNITNFPPDYDFKNCRNFRKVSAAPYLYDATRQYQKIVDYGKYFENIAICRRFSTNVWVLADDVERLKLRFKGNSRLHPSIVRFRTKTKSYYDCSVHVYNACQFTNFPHKTLKCYNRYTDVNESVENWIAKQHVRIVHGVFGPMYEGTSNTIYIIDRCRYDTNAGYYHDLFHELGHWSGRRSNLCRINSRDIKSYDYNSSVYAQEEVVAELAAIKLQTFFNVPVDFSTTSMYIDYYLNYFEDSEYARSVFKQADEDSDTAVLFLLESYFDEKATKSADDGCRKDATAD